NYLDSGWWDSNGTHDAGNKNYFSGQDNRPQAWDFFVFDLTGIHQVITGARLRAFNPSNGYGSPDPTEVFTGFDVTTPIPALRASGSGQTEIFDDLGSGIALGTQTVSAADNGQVVTIDLNGDGVAYLEAHRGGLVALGGALNSITGREPRYLFG